MGAWDEGRPIYGRLPGDNEGYRRDQEYDGYDPTLDVAFWLCTPWDGLLTETKSKVDAFYENYLDPQTALPEYLDWLAMLCGFTGPYWDAQWAVSIKRALIANSYNFIWISKGTPALFEWLFQVFSLDAALLIIGDFLADITILDAQVGDGNLKYYIVVQLKYLRTSTEWAMLERLNRLYGPVFCESRVLYDQFYADFSVAGDLVLS